MTHLVNVFTDFSIIVFQCLHVRKKKYIETPLIINCAVQNNFPIHEKAGLYRPLNKVPFNNSKFMYSLIFR